MKKNKEIEELPKALQKDKDKKKKKKNWKKILLIFLIIIILGVCSGVFLLYGPYSGFRDWLITTAMTTMTHQYLATWFYDDDTINAVLDKNKVKEVNEVTDTNTIVINKTATQKEYENEYEREILERDANADYKIINIKGEN